MVQCSAIFGSRSKRAGERCPHQAKNGGVCGIHVRAGKTKPAPAGMVCLTVVPVSLKTEPLPAPVPIAPTPIAAAPVIAAVVAPTAPYWAGHRDVFAYWTAEFKKYQTQHGLVGWRFTYDRAVRRLGLCRYTQKVISLSHHYVSSDTETNIRNIMLHEIAHALVGRCTDGPTHHGPKWKAKAREIGCTGDRCGTWTTPVAAKYTISCPNGCCKISRHKLVRDYTKRICLKCRQKLSVKKNH